jgi:N-methylhydantoinase A
MSLRIGIDVGGTFTDGILIDEETGSFTIAKVPSTPSDPSHGFMTAVSRLFADHQGVGWSDLEYLVHATTVVTNAVIEGKTSRAAFLVTEGFRDLLEIGRQTRSSLYDPQFRKLPPLVPRRHVFEVPERLDARGAVVRPIDVETVRGVARRLVEEEIETVAVCLLHSYRNPNHEQRVAEVLAEVAPNLLISLSSEIAPEFREYVRASTTVINAAVRPPVARYLARISEQVPEAGAEAGLLMMQSNGGVTDFTSAAERPVTMVESGPAAGVIAARSVARALDAQDAFSFDMGGTTAKVGLIQGGEPRVVKDYEVGAVAHAAGRGGGGYPIRTPVVDLVEIGAGGGSIAWIDEGGGLRVGPTSAGADPGPVCYQRGGEQPTVTDANLILGYLDPEYFLGGQMVLDRATAEAAIHRTVAEPLGMSVVDAAAGIVELANAAMVNALRLISVQRGYDPRDFLLVGFGGAGPLHANRLAAAVGIRRIAIPRSPGVYSSIGLVDTDLRRDDQMSVIEPTAAVADERALEMFTMLESRGRAALGEQGLDTAAIFHLRQLDMRYAGQGYELAVDVPEGAVSLDDAGAAFHAAHQRAFGFATPDEPTEVVNVRVGSVGRIKSPKMGSVPADTNWESARKGTRQAYFPEFGGFIDTVVYQRTSLGEGARVVGPAMLEEFDSTTVVAPGYQARVAVAGIVLIEPEAS